MKETNNLAELCALLVSDFHGKLAARVLSTLMERGASTAQEICFHSGMPLSHVRAALAILLQNSLLYHNSDINSTQPALYEANPQTAYNLICMPKIVQLVAEEYGEDAAELVQILCGLGCARLIDLEQAYIERHRTSTRPEKINGHANGNGSAHERNDFDCAESQQIVQKISEKLSDTILDLLDEDILELCSTRTFSNPKDVRAVIERQIYITYFGGGVPKGSRGQDQFHEYLRKKLLEVRDEPQNLKKSLMQKLHNARSENFGPKKRKLASSMGTKGFVSCADADPNAVVRLNFEKAAVLLRNQALIKYASDTLGPVTGEVYRVALRIMGKSIKRCHPDPLLDISIFGPEPGRLPVDLEPPPVTTLEIFSELPKDIDVSSGIGKSKGNVSTRRAGKVQPYPPKARLPFVDDEELDSEDDAIDDISDQDDPDETPAKIINRHDEQANGASSRGKVVQSADDSMEIDKKKAGGDNADELRFDQTRQHLLLLASSSQGFIRHKGLREGGEWVVDFKHVVTNLQRNEVDTFIEDKFTRQGLRLVNIVRQKGKLDDKALSTIAQMRKQDTNQLMSNMEVYGIVDIQEVPRDNNRLAARTIFLWFYDDNRVKTQILDNSYKAMLRCRQVLETFRQKDHEILALYERSDVKGREEERLHESTIAKYRQHMKTASNLLNSIMRVDDIVCLLRDF